LKPSNEVNENENEKEKDPFENLKNGNQAKNTQKLLSALEEILKKENSPIRQEKRKLIALDSSPTKKLKFSQIDVTPLSRMQSQSQHEKSDKIPGLNFNLSNDESEEKEEEKQKQNNQQGEEMNQKSSIEISNNEEEKEKEKVSMEEKVKEKEEEKDKNQFEMKENISQNGKKSQEKVPSQSNNQNEIRDEEEMESEPSFSNHHIPQVIVEIPRMEENSYNMSQAKQDIENSDIEDTKNENKEELESEKNTDEKIEKDEPEPKEEDEKDQKSQNVDSKVEDGDKDEKQEPQNQIINESEEKSLEQQQQEPENDKSDFQDNQIEEDDFDGDFDNEFEDFGDDFGQENDQIVENKQPIKKDEKETTTTMINEPIIEEQKKESTLPKPLISTSSNQKDDDVQANYLNLNSTNLINQKEDDDDEFAEFDDNFGDDNFEDEDFNVDFNENFDEVGEKQVDLKEVNGVKESTPASNSGQSAIAQLNIESSEDSIDEIDINLDLVSDFEFEDEDDEGIEDFNLDDNSQENGDIQNINEVKKVEQKHDFKASPQKMNPVSNFKTKEAQQPQQSPNQRAIPDTYPQQKFRNDSIQNSPIQKTPSPQNNNVSQTSSNPKNLNFNSQFNVNKSANSIQPRNGLALSKNFNSFQEKENSTTMNKTSSFNQHPSNQSNQFKPLTPPESPSIMNKVNQFKSSPSPSSSPLVENKTPTQNSKSLPLPNSKPLNSSPINSSPSPSPSPNKWNPVTKNPVNFVNNQTPTKGNYVNSNNFASKNQFSSPNSKSTPNFSPISPKLFSSPSPLKRSPPKPQNKIQFSLPIPTIQEWENNSTDSSSKQKENSKNGSFRRPLLSFQPCLIPNSSGDLIQIKDLSKENNGSIKKEEEKKQTRNKVFFFFFFLFHFLFHFLM